ncbi:MAG: cell division protein FtsA [Alphaproteobacteria bacterium]|nr:cell division protein FtsA [Alphaproteobacteria bacterium]
MQNGSMTKNGLVAALDVGSSKVCCFIARLQSDAPPRVIGVGHQASQGVKSGVITDMEAAEGAILQAVHDAEKMAGETVRSVIVNLSAGRPASHAMDIEVSIAGHAVEDADVRRALSQTREAKGLADNELIHLLPTGFAIDGHGGIRDPRGMYGDRLGVSVHMITAATGAVRNLKTTIERCHLAVDSFVVSAYAAGLATLVEDEIALGATLIDMGGGTTSIAVFHDGQVVFTDSIAVGGKHVTSDIARGLSTPVASAERIKTLYGCAIAVEEDELEVIDVPQVGEDNHETPNHVPRSILNGVIQPRLEETLELVRGRLEASGVSALAGRRVVLTGGASQIQGARELAAAILDRHVRLGRPQRLRGLAEAVSGPAFATVAGLIAFAQGSTPYWASPLPIEIGQPASIVGRLQGWIRAHL